MPLKMRNAKCEMKLCAKLYNADAVPKFAI